MTNPLSASSPFGRRMARGWWLILVRRHGENGARQRAARDIAKSYARQTYGQRLSRLSLDQQMECLDFGHSQVSTLMKMLDVIPPEEQR
jgi:hypothetical protein